MRWIRKIHASWPGASDRRQRHVAAPAGLGRGEEQRHVEDDPAGEQQPVGEGVQAREGHVARADHQRQEVVAQAGHHRHDEQEDHRRPVHREQLVVGLRSDQVVVRDAQLQAHQQRLDPAEQEEHEGRDHVQDPDLLVVGRGQPPRPAAALGLGVVGDDLRDGLGVGGHWGTQSPERGLRGSRPSRDRSACQVACARRRPAGWRRRCLLLVAEPGVELGGGHGVDLGDHAGVALAADLGALAPVDARLVDPEPGVVVIAGDRLQLAAELRESTTSARRPGSECRS